MTDNYSTQEHIKTKQNKQMRKKKKQSTIENKVYNLFPFNPSGPPHGHWSRLANETFSDCYPIFKNNLLWLCRIRISASLHLLDLWTPSVAISLRCSLMKQSHHKVYKDVSWFHPHMIQDSSFPCLPAPGYSPRINARLFILCDLSSLSFGECVARLFLQDSASQKCIWIKL